MAVLTELKRRLNLNCPLVFVPGYLVLNWMETEDPTTDTTGSDGSEGEPEGVGGDRYPPTGLNTMNKVVIRQ